MADKSCIADGAKYATVFITVSKCLLWGALPDYKDALHLKKEDCKLCDKQAKHDDFTMMNMCERAYDYYNSKFLQYLWK